MTTNPLVSTPKRHAPETPRRGLYVSPPGDINAATPDVRVDIGKRTATSFDLRGMRAALVMPIPLATSSADRRKGRRATPGGALLLDILMLHGTQCSTVQIYEREEASVALNQVTEDMRPPAMHLSQWTRGALSHFRRRSSMVPPTSRMTAGQAKGHPQSVEAKWEGEAEKLNQGLSNSPMSAKRCHSGLARPSFACDEHEVYRQRHGVVLGHANVSTK